MKPWNKTIRRETGLIEHICEHGVGHPAHGSVHWMKLNGSDGFGSHGCDGCCHDAKWQLADAREGCEKANEMFFDALKKFASEHSTPPKVMAVEEVEKMLKEILEKSKVVSVPSPDGGEMSAPAISPYTVTSIAAKYNLKP